MGVWEYGSVGIHFTSFQILNYSNFRHELTYNQAGKRRNT